MSNSVLSQRQAWLRFSRHQLTIAIALLWGNVSLLLAAAPASAHHAMGGGIPSNWFEGFLSGLAHPIIGLDHFAFVVAIGLLAGTKHRSGFLIPLAFVLTALSGTVVHLMALNLPAPEVFVSLSVLMFGSLLALKQSPHVLLLTVLAAIAGLFHGYAYGEAIVGAEATPLMAYLIGFTLIQLGIASGAYAIAKTVLSRPTEQPLLPLRFAGCLICGTGVAFLSTALM